MLVSFKKEIGKSGFLTKQGIKFKSWKRRYFELDATTLNYFLSPHHTKPKGIIHLRNATVMACNKRPLWLQIESVARDDIGGGRFLLVAEWQEECDSPSRTASTSSTTRPPPRRNESTHARCSTAGPCDA